MYFLLMVALMSGTTNYCELCHSDVKVEFASSVHAREEVTCISCHGGNDSASTREGAHLGAFRSLTNRAKIPESCATCHSDRAKMKAFGLPTDQLALYQTSIHGKGLAAGDTKVAVCTDCHGVHRILPPTDPESPTHPRNIPTTCARCHANKSLMASYSISTSVVSDYEQSVHAQALREGNQQAPVCTNCHGTHGAAPPGIGDVSIVCGHCHEAERNNFRLSPHAGAMSAAGIPECEACHSNHNIQRTSETLWSSICLECHDSGSTEAKRGDQIRAGLRRTDDEIRAAEQAIQNAKKIPLDVSDYEARLEEARTYMVQVLPISHSLAFGDIQDLTRRADSIAVEIQVEIGEKQKIFKTRRFVLIVVWFYILLTIAIVYQYRKQLESPSKKE